MTGHRWSPGRPRLLAIGRLPASGLAIDELLFHTRTTEHHQHPHMLAWREVLNMHWSPDPAAFRRHDKGIAVRVWIVWDRDGGRRHVVNVAPEAQSPRLGPLSVFRSTI